MPRINRIPFKIGQGLINGFPSDVWNGLKLAWFSSDTLTPTVGNALTLDRDGRITAINSGVLDAYGTDELTPEHWIGGQYGNQSGYRTKLDSWSYFRATMAAQANGPIDSKDYYQFRCDNTLNTHIARLPDTAWTYGDVPTTVALICRKSTNARYFRLNMVNLNGIPYPEYDIDLDNNTFDVNTPSRHIDSRVTELADDWVLFEFLYQQGSTTVTRFFMYLMDNSKNITFVRPEADWGVDIAAAWQVNSPIYTPLSYPVPEDANPYVVPDSNLSQAMATTSGKHALVGFSGRIRHDLSRLRETNARGISLVDNSDASNKARSLYLDATGVHYVDVANGITLSITDAGLLANIGLGNKFTALCNGTRLIVCDHDDGDTIYSTGNDTGQTLTDADLDIISIGSFVSADSYSEHFDGDKLQGIYGEYNSVIGNADLVTSAIAMGAQY